ncbi:MAG: dihydrolipoyl dehydrogenase [Acidiferrobacterales bacterium]|nr:dihydrolipoyl dehydrogenase [Gammaproteobacteria bacterium]
MSQITEVKVPDIGEFKDVDIIEVHVAPDDTVNIEDPLITLESDKATMDVPAPLAGVVDAVKVKVGGKVSEGSVILTLKAQAKTAGAGTRGATKDASPAPPAPAPAKTPAAAASGDVHAEVLVLGAGPGGYTAAFRAADLGKQTVLVERYPRLGGVCLNVGCIPSKALLHTAKVIAEAGDMAQHGVSFGAPRIDLDKLRGWKDQVVGRLTTGLAGLAKQRKVKVIQGRGTFVSPKVLEVETADGKLAVSFDQAIIAAGSQASTIPGIPHDDPRVIDSTGALELPDIPKHLLVIGGGIIGLEVATVYYELGAKVTVVELLDSLMVGVDKDIVRPLQRRIDKQYENIYLKTKVTRVEPQSKGLKVFFEGDEAPASQVFDRVLVAVGRIPNGKSIGAESAGVAVDERGFIPVDKQQRTNVSHIFAIGDVVGEPLLAHKATHEGKVAAEVAAGLKSSFDARVIPSVAYTDPEVAWTGVTEAAAKEQKLDYGKGVFPWAASGRALGLGRDEGLTKLLFDTDSGRVIGAGIVGPNAGDLIAEVGLAIEMGCDAQDIGLTIHPHPTLSETVAFAAEAFEGTITDLYMPRKKK